MPTKKEIASTFLTLSARGDSREAFKLYTAPGFKHHNAFFKGDGNSLMIAMEENVKKFPEKVLEIQHALEDGDMVALHSKVKLTPDDLGIGLVHIFRFEDERIAELWDLGQAVPADMVNELGMF